MDEKQSNGAAGEENELENERPAETGTETANGSPDIEIIRDEEPAEPQQMQKRTKRSNRKELLDRLQEKNAQLMELDKRAQDLADQLKIKEDRFLRLAAEFENFRKRTQREWELLQKRANADLIGEIMGGMDNFDRAFAAFEGADKALQEGLKLIYSGLLDILGRAGVTEMEALGAKFDPQYHEAIGEIESDAVEDGHIAQVVRKGYLLNGELLRPARVMVSKKKS